MCIYIYIYLYLYIHVYIYIYIYIGVNLSFYLAFIIINFFTEIQLYEFASNWPNDQKYSYFLF